MGKRLDKVEGISVDQRIFLIDQWIFNEKYRSLAKRKLIDGVSFEQIANEYQLSVNQAKNIVKDAIDIIYEKYKSDLTFKDPLC